MKRLFLAPLLFFPLAAKAQGPIQCSFATNPLPGYVYTYCGPSIGAVWTTPPGGISGPGITVVDHVPTWADTIGLTLNETSPNRSSVLWNNAANYASSANYGGTSASAGIVEVLGASGAPNSTQDAVAIFQKWSNSTTNYNAGINPTVYVSNILKTGSSTTRGTALYSEAQMDVNSVSSANFIEGIRGHGTINAGVAGGEATGVVAYAGEGAGATHNYMFGIEAEVANNSVDASFNFNGVGSPSSISHFEANYLATSRAAKKPLAGFMINPFTAVGSAWPIGYFVPAASPNVVGAPVSDAAFRSDAPSIWGLDVTGHGAGPTFGAVGIPNNIPIRANKQDASSTLNIMVVDVNNKLLIGSDTGLVNVSIGAATVPTVLGSYLEFFHESGVTAPSGGSFRIYVDADNKLKAVGGGGTITVLANP
jgi:hypothetical protein